MSGPPPPDFSGKHLDFSRWHPLDHPVWSSACKTFYGGRRHHLLTWWIYQGRPALFAATRCKIGWHEPGTVWRKERPSGWTTWDVCMNCGKALSKPRPH